MSYYDEVVYISAENRSYLRNKNALVFHSSDKRVFRPRKVRLDPDNKKRWSFSIFRNGQETKVTEEDKNWFFAK